MASTAPKVPEVERRDAPEMIDQQAAALVKLIQKSKHFVVFTGAGVSTSAGSFALQPCQQRFVSSVMCRHSRLSWPRRCMDTEGSGETANYQGRQHPPSHPDANSYGSIGASKPRNSQVSRQPELRWTAQKEWHLTGELHFLVERTPSRPISC